MTRRTLALAAALFGAAAVGLGAFGAHALRGTLDAAAMSTWQTAVQYLFWHVLAALVAVHADEEKAARFAGLAFLVGATLFSGSLFALALGAPRGFGAITPVGGVALIAGWLLLAFHYARRS